jgi:hypothetical protein
LAFEVPSTVGLVASVEHGGCGISIKNLWICALHIMCDLAISHTKHCIAVESKLGKWKDFMS